MPNTKPIVTIATACERVLIEKDGVCSIIRVVDTFFVPELPPGAPSNVQIEINAIVTLKSGDLEGKFEIGMRIRKPDGTIREIPHKYPLLLKGGEHGTNILVSIQHPHSELGLFWVDVLYQEEVLASFPIKLVRAAKKDAASPTDTNSQPS